jgi:tRNA pseudouridine55 synthase
MVTMVQVEQAALDGNRALDALLLPVDTALSDWPAVQLDADSSYYIRQGQPVVVARAPTEGWVRLYEGEDRFIGVGQIQDDGKVAPKRLLGGK